MPPNLKPYPAYKPSRVEWLGDVPAHWEVRRLRNAIDMWVSNVDKHVKEGEFPVRLCNYVDVYKNDYINQQMQFIQATATVQEIERFRLLRDDVLITKDSETWNDIGVPALVTEPAPNLISGYHLALLRPRAGGLSGGYSLRALQSRSLANQFHIKAKGVTRFGLTHADIKSVCLPFPTLPEQAAIVRYLDNADERIRRYVKGKHKLVRLLEEDKQAIINRVVTRGLDPNVRLKPSGLEWLGDVPAHWEVMRTRFLLGEVDTRSATGKETHLSMSQVLGLVPSHMVERTLTSDSYVGGKLCEKGDLVLNRLKAHLGVFALAKQPGVISPDYSVFRNRSSVEMEYFEQVFRLSALRTELRIRAKGIVEGFWRLYTEDLFDIRLPVPPLREQTAIVKRLHKVTADINSVLDRTRRQIELVQEYRTRLIDDVVTGKVDVRQVAAKLPGETDDSEPCQHGIALTHQAEDVGNGFDIASGVTA